MKYIFLALLFVSGYYTSSAQEIEDPVEYLELLNTDQRQISERLMRYISATVHGRSEAAVQRKREQLVKTIGKVRDNVASAPDFQGDATLKDAMLEYFTLNYSVMNEDYSDIIDMKQVAEESYDAMEAYFKAQDMAAEKVNVAQVNVEQAITAFTTEYNIKLVKSEDQLSKMLEQANAVADYHNQLYLIVFKAHLGRKTFLESVQTSDIDAIEAARITLVEATDEGLEKLKDVPMFRGDGSLIAAAERRLQLYKEEANAMGFTAIELIKQSKNVEKLSEALSDKKPAKRTKEEVEAYNKAADEANNTVAEFNSLSNKYNQLGQLDHQFWQQTVEQFRRNHVPKYGTEEQYS